MRTSSLASGNSPSKPSRRVSLPSRFPPGPAPPTVTSGTSGGKSGTGSGGASSAVGAQPHHQAAAAAGGAALPDGVVPSSPHIIYGELGRGDGSVVLLARSAGAAPASAMTAADESAAPLRAVKVVNKLTVLRRRRAHRVETEYRLLRELRPHPFIVRCFGGFQTPTAAVFELELCSRGTLRDLLRVLPSNRLESADTRRHILAVALTAIRYLHLHGWVYRDLKPDNLLVRGDGTLCLSDFDLSARLEADGFVRRCKPAGPLTSAHPHTTVPGRAGSSGNFVMPTRRSSRMSADSVTETAVTTASLQNTPPIAPVTATPLAGDSFGSANGARPSSHHRRHGSGRSAGSAGSFSPPLPGGGGGGGGVGGLRAAGSSSLGGGKYATLSDGTALYDGDGLAGVAPSPHGSTMGAPLPSSLMALPPAPGGGNRRRGSFVGTPVYMAPEVVSGAARQTAAVDMWGLGCLMYELTFGVPPFQGSSEEDALDRIVRHDRVPLPAYPPLTRDHKELMLALLAKDPAARPTASEVAAHRYFRDVDFTRLDERPPPLRPYVCTEDEVVEEESHQPVPARRTSGARRLLRHTATRTKRRGPPTADSLPLATAAAYDDGVASSTAGVAASLTTGGPLDESRPVLPEVDVSSTRRPGAGMPLDEYANASAVAEEQLNAASTSAAAGLVVCMPPLADATSAATSAAAGGMPPMTTTPNSAGSGSVPESGASPRPGSDVGCHSPAPPHAAVSSTALFAAAVSFSFFEPFGEAPGAAPSAHQSPAHPSAAAMASAGRAAAQPSSGHLPSAFDLAQTNKKDGADTAAAGMSGVLGLSDECLRGDDLRDVLAAMGGCRSTDFDG